MAETSNDNNSYDFQNNADGTEYTPNVNLDEQNAGDNFTDQNLNSEEEDPSTSESKGNTILLKIFLWALALFIGIKIIMWLVSVVMGIVAVVTSWIVNLFELMLVAIFIYFSWFSEGAKRSNKESERKWAQWEKDEIARFGGRMPDEQITYDSEPKPRPQETRRRDNTYTERLYDSRDGVYRDVTTNRDTGRSTDSYGRTGYRQDSDFRR